MSEKKVKPGIDVFLDSDLSELKRHRIALLSNYSATNSSAVPTIELLSNEPDLDISTLLAPEHGIRGNFQAGENVPVQKDKKTGLTVLSLYDQSDPKSINLPDNTDDRMRTFDISNAGKKINEKALKDIDSIILDLQDVGTRIYTYISTMGYLMESISGTDKKLIILDRPNPINGENIEGPVLEYPEYSSFVGFYSIPVRHGMTIGELALMFNSEIYSNNVRLSIVCNGNWERGMWFDQTGLRWVKPSPNLPDLTSATVYPGMVFLEGTNISEGRGSSNPFEIFGAPWIKGIEVSEELNRRNLKGVNFEYTSFSPDFSKYSGEDCSGVRIFITDRNEYSPFETMLNIISVVKEFHQDDLIIYREYFNMIAGNSWLSQNIDKGSDVESIVGSYQKRLSEFSEYRKKYLLYD